VTYNVFRYNRNSGEHEYVPAKKKCIYCSFAILEYRSMDFVLVEGCQISKEIREGTRVCPHKRERRTRRERILGG
jgi:hypothetical protein